jgi:hypothetical protein
MLDRLEAAERKDGHQRHIMNLAFFSPESLYESNHADYRNGSSKADPPSQLYFLYMWTNTGNARGGAHNKWVLIPNETGDFTDLAKYPLLAQRIREVLDGENRTISCVSFGPPEGVNPESFFLRATDAKNFWHYSWKLPEPYDSAMQRFIRGGDDGTFGGSRIRAIEFGYHGSWVIYGGDNEYEYYLAKHYNKTPLEEALRYGKDSGLSINACRILSSSLRPTNSLTRKFH